MRWNFLKFSIFLLYFIVPFHKFYYLKDLYFTLNYCVKENFTLDERKIIKESAEEWNKATNGIIKIVLSEGNCGKENSILKVNTDNRLIMSRDRFTFNATLGVFEPNNKNIYLVSERITTQRIFKSVLIHEFGHALSLQHIDDKNSVMYLFLEEQITCITKADAQEFCKVYLCKLEDLKYCSSSDSNY